MRQLLLFAAFLFLGTVAAHASGVRMALLTAQPYGMVDSNGKPAGLYPDIARALSLEAGVPVQVELVPFARAANEVARGGADATIMMSNAFSDNKAIEAVVVFYTRQILLLRPGLESPTTAGLEKLSIGRLNGGCQSLADDASIHVQFQEINSQESAVGMLALGRIDAFCSTEEAVRAAVKQQGLEEKLGRSQVVELGARPVWLMLSPALPRSTGDALVGAMTRLQKNGKLAGIFREHLGAGYVLQLQEKRAPARPDGTGNRPKTQ